MIYPNFIIYLAALLFSLRDDGITLYGNLSVEIHLDSVNKLWMVILF